MNTLGATISCTCDTVPWKFSRECRHYILGWVHSPVHAVTSRFKSNIFGKFKDLEFYLRSPGIFNNSNYNIKL